MGLLPSKMCPWGSLRFLFVWLIGWFGLICFFKTGFLCVVLAVLDLAL